MTPAEQRHEQEAERLGISPEALSEWRRQRELVIDVANMADLAGFPVSGNYEGRAVDSSDDLANAIRWTNVVLGDVRDAMRTGIRERAR